MAKKTLGRIFPVPEGTYSASKTYKELSIVTYNGNSYICKKQSSGNEPTNTTYWQLMASKGEQGIQGIQGIQGEPGEPGSSTTTTTTAKTYDKYVVVCVAGQSNAVGYDESVVDIGSKLAYVSRDTNRIKQLGFYGTDNLELVDLGYCAQSMQDMRQENGKKETVRRGTKGLHLPLANLMLDYIPDDYGVLVLPIAYGGTGFVVGNAGNGTYNETKKKPNETGNGEGTTALKWGANTAYYRTLKDRIIYALEKNDKNLFAGIIWCQGENDKGQASAHYEKFQEMTNLLFSELNAHNNGALKARTPKGTFDKNIWYNMETVSYWYTTEDCSDIWANYKTWNKDTYIEIPRNTDSNDKNGTADTASVKAKHYGNNAYQKVIAPLVLQKLIDMDTFGKRVNVVEPECTGGTGGGSSYAVATEGTRVLKQADITKKSNINFVVDGTGKCHAPDIETLRNTFSLNSENQPCVSIGNSFKMEWTVKRSMYWMIIEGSLSGNYLVLALGGGTTGKCSKLTNSPNLEGNGLTEVNGANSAYSYTFQTGDKVRVYRNPDNSLSIYRTDAANGVFQHWFDFANKDIYEDKLLGFACGIAGDEFKNSFENTDRNVLFEGMKIQKQELFPNNKILDLQLDEMARELAASRT